MANLSDILSPVKEKQEDLQPLLACLVWANINFAGQWRIQQRMMLQCACLCDMFDNIKVQHHQLNSSFNAAASTQQLQRFCI